MSASTPLGPPDPSSTKRAHEAAPHPLVRTPEEWRDALVRLGERPFRAMQVFQWIHRRGVVDARAMTDLPVALRDRLAEDGLVPALSVDTVRRSLDDTRKLLVRFGDASTVETVLIPAVSGPGSAADRGASSAIADADASAIDDLFQETMLTASLLVCAGTGLAVAALGGPVGAVVLAAVLNLMAALGRLGFESIVQREAPDANQGRAFATFETRFQLAWAGGAFVAVAIQVPGQLGFLIVGAVAVGASIHVLGGRRLSRRRPGRARGREPRSRSGSGTHRAR